MPSQIDRRIRRVEKFDKPLTHRSRTHFVDHQPWPRANFQPHPKDHVAAAQIGLMHLGRQDIHAIHQAHRRTGNRIQFLRRIRYRAAGARIPRPGSMPHRS